MKKQLLFLMMILLPMVALADDSGSCGENITWTYMEATHTLTISGTGEMANYQNPSNAPWYIYHRDIVKIVIEDGVTSMGSNVFANCYDLVNITIPSSVTSIGDQAFYGCYGLTSFTIPNSVTSIGNSAFYACTGLTSITIGNSVISIGSSAFEGCIGLQKVIISDIAAWCSIEFDNYTANPLYYAHHLYSNENTEIKDLVIPNSVTSIGDRAFSGCSGLTSVTIPNSITSIGKSAFSRCI